MTRIDFIAQEKLKKLENVQFSLSDAWENTEFGVFLDENGMIGNFFELVAWFCISLFKKRKNRKLNATSSCTTESARNFQCVILSRMVTPRKNEHTEKTNTPKKRCRFAEMIFLEKLIFFCFRWKNRETDFLVFLEKPRPERNSWPLQYCATSPWLRAWRSTLFF